MVARVRRWWLPPTTYAAVFLFLSFVPPSCLISLPLVTVVVLGWWRRRRAAYKRAVAVAQVAGLFSLPLLLLSLWWYRGLGLRETPFPHLFWLLYSFTYQV